MQRFRLAAAGLFAVALPTVADPVKSVVTSPSAEVSYITSQELRRSIKAVHIAVGPSGGAVDLLNNAQWTERVARALNQHGITVSDDAPLHLEVRIHTAEGKRTGEMIEHHVVGIYVDFAFRAPSVVPRTNGLRKSDNAIIFNGWSYNYAAFVRYDGNFVLQKIDEAIAFVLNPDNTNAGAASITLPRSLATLTSAGIAAVPRAKWYEGLGPLQLQVDHDHNAQPVPVVPDDAVGRAWAAALQTAGFKLVAQSPNQIRHELLLQDRPVTRGGVFGTSMVWSGQISRIRVVQPGVFMVNGVPRWKEVIVWRDLDHDISLIKDSRTALRRMMHRGVGEFVKAASDRD